MTPQTSPTTWSPNEFFAHVVSGEAVIVRVSSADVAFNYPFMASLFGTARCGVVKLTGIDRSNLFLNVLLATWKTQLGWQRSAAILEGYYLFMDNSAVAYHPGTLDRDDIPNIIAGGVSHSLSALVDHKIAQAFFSAVGNIVMDFGPAKRMAEFFRRAAKEYAAKKQSRRLGAESPRWEGAKEQQRILESEVQKAYRLLNLSEDATDEEFKSAYRSKTLEVHPDRAEPAKRAERDEQMAQLNVARDLIERTRGK